MASFFVFLRKFRLVSFSRQMLDDIERKSELTSLDRSADDHRVVRVFVIPVGLFSSIEYD